MQSARKTLDWTKKLPQFECHNNAFVSTIKTSFKLAHAVLGFVRNCAIENIYIYFFLLKVTVNAIVICLFCVRRTLFVSSVKVEINRTAFAGFGNICEALRNSLGPNRQRQNNKQTKRLFSPICRYLLSQICVNKNQDNNSTLTYPKPNYIATQKKMNVWFFLFTLF